MTQLRGIIATPVTPFNSDYSMDERGLADLINFLLDWEVADGFSGPMHIGESLNLTPEERMRHAEITVTTVAGRVPVIVNVSFAGTDQAIALARHAEKIGATAVLALPPYYWAPPPEALYEHFAAIASSVGIGLVAYNSPHKLEVSLTPALLARLVEQFDNFVGLKDAAFNCDYVTEVCRVILPMRPDFALFAGVEYMLPYMVLGGCGSFSPCGEIAPRMVKDLYNACQRGDIAAAREQQYRVSRLWQILFKNYPANLKAALELLGRPVGPPRRPILPSTPGARDELEAELRALGIFENEPQGWKGAVAGRV